MYAIASMKTIFTATIGSLFTLILLAGTTASGVVIASYDFDGLSGDEVTLAAASSEANISASVLSRGAAYDGYAAAFTTNGFGTQPGAVDENDAFRQLHYTIQDAADNDGYYQLTLTPAEGYQLSVDTIVFGSRRASNRTGPNLIGARSSLDTYTADLVSGVDASGAGGNVSAVTTLDFGSSLQNVATEVTIRIYGYDRNNGLDRGFGIWTISNQNASDVDGAGTGNFVINGSISPVPEPETYALIVSALAFGLVVWRRRR